MPRSDVSNGDLSLLEDLIHWKPENRQAYLKEIGLAAFLTGLEINARASNNIHQVHLWTDLFKEKLDLMPIAKGKLAKMKDNFINSEHNNPGINAKSLKKAKEHLDEIVNSYHNWNDNGFVERNTKSSSDESRTVIEENWKDIQDANHKLMNNELMFLSNMIHPEKLSLTARVVDIGKTFRHYLASA